MQIKNDKYYSHRKGRKIHVVGKVTTDTWGKMWVIEEKDNTGASISCVELKDSDLADDNWIEIGRGEWLDT